MSSCFPIYVAQDESLRLWNIQTKVCLLIVAGEGGHTAEVLAVVGQCIASHEILVFQLSRQVGIN